MLVGGALRAQRERAHMVMIQEHQVCMKSKFYNVHLEAKALPQAQINCLIARQSREVMFRPLYPHSWQSR